MAKVIQMPFAGRDHPIYKGGPTLYTPRLGRPLAPLPPAPSAAVDAPYITQPLPILIRLSQVFDAFLTAMWGYQMPRHGTAQGVIPAIEYTIITHAIGNPIPPSSRRPAPTPTGSADATRAPLSARKRMPVAGLTRPDGTKQVFGSDKAKNRVFLKQLAIYVIRSPLPSVIARSEATRQSISPSDGPCRYAMILDASPTMTPDHRGKHASPNQTCSLMSHFRSNGQHWQIAERPVGSAGRQEAGIRRKLRVTVW